MQAHDPPCQIRQMRETACQNHRLPATPCQSVKCAKPPVKTMESRSRKFCWFAAARATAPALLARIGGPRMTSEDVSTPLPTGVFAEPSIPRA